MSFIGSELAIPRPGPFRCRHPELVLRDVGHVRTYGKHNNSWDFRAENPDPANTSPNLDYRADFWCPAS